MVRVQQFMTYGFLPWTIMFGTQEDNEGTCEEGQTDWPLEQVGVSEARDPAGISGSLTQVKFRRALIDVDDPGEFWSGVVGGQVAMLEEEGPLTGPQIFALFEDAVRDV